MLARRTVVSGKRRLPNQQERQVNGTMSAALRRLAVALLFTLPTWAHAQSVGYTVAFDELYRVDLNTGSAEAVGIAGSYAAQRIGDIEGLAFSPDGTLYGAADGQRLLVRLDQATGKASVVGAMPVPTAGEGTDGSPDFGLSFTCNGKLWLASDKSMNLWEVTPGTGQLRLVGNMGVRISGLAARGNALYGISAEGDEGIYFIDTSNAHVDLMAKLNPTQRYISDAGLDFDRNGQLYATFDYLPPPSDSDPLAQYSDLAKIDLTTGAVTVIGQIKGAPKFVGLEGLAIAPPMCTGVNGQVILPVPATSAPAGIVLGGLVLLLAVFFGRRFAR